MLRQGKRLTINLKSIQIKNVRTRQVHKQMCTKLTMLLVHAKRLGAVHAPQMLHIMAAS